ncbi:MAG: hypothetical protein BGO49_08085 [Planctomycetales bacterium 71-10]|nr:MAG: hypothetical protein BGO49_08085 [Planctomycetales bacterium 71-10]
MFQKPFQFLDGADDVFIVVLHGDETDANALSMCNSMSHVDDAVDCILHLAQNREAESASMLLTEFLDQLDDLIRIRVRETIDATGGESRHGRGRPRPQEFCDEHLYRNLDETRD